MRNDVDAAAFSATAGAEKGQQPQSSRDWRRARPPACSLEKPAPPGVGRKQAKGREYGRRGADRQMPRGLDQRIERIAERAAGENSEPGNATAEIAPGVEAEEATDS